MVTPPGEPLESSTQEQSGFWVELRDRAGRTLRRQLLHDPIRYDVEVFSDDPEQSLARIPVERPSGVFVVVVPEMEDADYVALIATPPEQHAARAPAREIARFSLAEAPGGRGEEH